MNYYETGGYYTVKDFKPLKGIPISGPLSTPSRIPYKYVLEMVRSGYEVYEHNKYNKAQKVRVTIDNINDENKFTLAEGLAAKKADEVKVEEKSSVPTPVVTKEEQKDYNNNSNKKDKKKDKTYHNDNKKDDGNKSVMGEVPVTKSDNFEKI